jgi:predicted transcriptional regulator
VAESSAKQMALRALEQLPDDATLDDAMERLYFLTKVERGLADADAGRVVPHEEVLARFGLRDDEGPA